MRLPSIKTIETGLSVDHRTAMRVHKEMTDLRNGRTPDERVALQCIDDLIGGHGVEYIRSSQDTMRKADGLEYVNMGDPYRATVLFDHAAGTFYVGCWGDWTERYPGRFGE